MVLLGKKTANFFGKSFNFGFFDQQSLTARVSVYLEFCVNIFLNC